MPPSGRMAMWDHHVPSTFLLRQLRGCLIKASSKCLDAGFSLAARAMPHGGISVPTRLALSVLAQLHIAAHSTMPCLALTNH